MPTIARLRPEDVEGLRQLVLSILAEFDMREDPVLDADLLTPLDTYEAVWVATDDGGALVGSVALRREDGDAYYLKRMYVRPDQRGTGLGSALLQTALDHARTHGARTVHLDTSPRWSPPNASTSAPASSAPAPAPRKAHKTAAAKSSTPLRSDRESEQGTSPPGEFRRSPAREHAGLRGPV